MAGHPSPEFCACCTPSALAPQADRLNRPGLSAVRYRVGTFASFRRAMLESIARQPALAALTSRADDEYAVTLIELFAAVGDVLTFYNERIANELFLRTARERDSVLRLVRLIGYRLRPGLAATTLLSFVLDAGAQTRIGKGLKVMSVPGQDEEPQIFETIEQIVAHADLNEPAIFAPPFAWEAFRQGSATGPLARRPEGLRADDRFLIFGRGTIEEKRVESLSTGPAGDRLAFDPPILHASLWPGIARAAGRIQRLRFFGHNAPPTHNVFVPANPPAVPWPTWIVQPIPGGLAAGLSDYPLDGRYDGLQPGAQLLVDAGPGQQPRLRTAVVTAVESRNATLGPLSDSVTHVTLRQTIRGRPALAALPAGAPLVLAISGTGAVLFLAGGTPRRWVLVDGEESAADVAATVTAGLRIDLLARGANRTLRQRRIGAPGWVEHGGILTSPPRPLLIGATLWVFVRGADFGLWVIDATSGAPGFWFPLGGILTSAPAPVALGGPNVAVFVRGLDRALWMRRWNGAVWSNWSSLGGVLASAPVAASTGPGRVDVVAIGEEGNLLHRRLDAGEWSPWRDLGGEAIDEPAIVAAPADRVDVFVRGRTGELRHIARNGAAWTPWASLDGKLGSAPAAVRSGGGLHVFARGADGAIVQRSWTGAVWQPWAGHGEGLGPIADRRATRIYEIAAEDIAFRGYDYPEAVTEGRLALRAGASRFGWAHLAKGRRILLRSGTRLHAARVTATREVAASPGDAPDHLLVDFSPPLSRPIADAVLFGNVAEASHGETQPEEALGHGDASRPFQAARLQRAPLTYLPSATGVAGDAALEVRVNGERWSEVPSLYDRKPTERVYTARQTDEGETLLTFGDGRNGSRLPSGAMNVVARYRKGLGLAGRMKAGQLSMPLERPPGLRNVANPLPADGAADPEKRDDARGAAPGTVRTFGRAVSLRDFEWLATASGLAARAYVTWVWHQLERAVHVTVAGPGGDKLSPASLAKLAAGLRAASDPNRPLFLAHLVRVPVVVRAKLVVDPAFEPDAVRDAARVALLDLFAFDSMPLGRAIHASSVYAALHEASGVVAVDLDLFHLKGHADLTPAERTVRSVTAAPLQQHIRIFPARPAPPFADIDRFARAGFEGTVPPPVLAAEQAWIADPARDVELVVVGAL